MADDDVEGTLDEAQLNQLVQHLQMQEEASQESALESVESFNLWISSHPALRQMAIVGSISEIGPAILNFLRALLGLGPKRGESKTSEGD
jgi:hypothetical protein